MLAFSETLNHTGTTLWSHKISELGGHPQRVPLTHSLVLPFNLPSCLLAYHVPGSCAPPHTSTPLLTRSYTPPHSLLRPLSLLVPGRSLLWQNWEMYAGELDAPFFEFEERESPFVAMMRAGEDDPKAERFMSGGGPASRDDEGGDLRRGDGVAGGLCSAATLSKHRFACIQKRVRRALLQAGDEGRAFVIALEAFLRVWLATGSDDLESLGEYMHSGYVSASQGACAFKFKRSDQRMLAHG